METGKRDSSEFLDESALEQLGYGRKLAFVASKGSSDGQPDKYYKVYRGGLYEGWTTRELGKAYKATR